MAWACMAVSGKGLLIFTDDLMYDDRIINLVQNHIAYIGRQENANRFIGKFFIWHQNNDPTPCQFSQLIYMGK